MKSKHKANLISTSQFDAQNQPEVYRQKKNTHTHKSQQKPNSEEDLGESQGWVFEKINEIG